MRRTLVLLVGALGLACAPFRLRPTQPIRFSRPRPDADQAADRTRVRFTRAAQKDDWRAMAQLFSEDGLVITAGGDSVQGREALEQYFTTPAAAAAAAVLHFGKFSRERYLHLCTDGARERGTFTSDSGPGRYAIRWGWDSLGAAEIRRLSLETPVGPQRPALPDCYSHTEYLQSTRRLSVSMFGLWTSGGYPQGALVSAMHEAGWNKKRFVCPSFEPCAGQNARLPQTNQSTQALGLGIIRYRFSSRFATEVLVSTGSQGSVLGIDTATAVNSDIEYSWSDHVVGAALTYERAGIRIGAGPALEHARWHMVQTSLITNARSDAFTHVNAIGVQLQLGVHVGLFGPLAIDVRADARRFPKTELPGHYLTVSQNSTFVGVGLGTVF